MAMQQQVHVRRALQDAPQLHSFIIPNARPTGRQLGRGSYGTVEELEIDGLVCAGKKLYDALIDPEDKGAQRMVDKYYNECSLLSDLRHPHIVQFLGICFLPDSRLPVLVMERLQGSLDELLENTADIPLSTKVSILQDVARGLVYLHNRSPSVIHRDLSARNVLLNSAMTAKIADLGNSRIADIPPGQTMTPVPGAQVYMPPEALDSSQRYGPPLDMFSFGHLTLFTAIQVFPKDLLTSTYYDPRTRQVKARTELERRGKFIDILHEKFEKKHPLTLLIKGCLKYEPVKRPTARQVLEMLGQMRATVRDPYSRLQLEKVLKEKETEVQQIPLLRSELEQLTEKCENNDQMLAAKEQEFEAKYRALLDECATLKGRLEEKTEEIKSLQVLNNILQKERAEGLSAVKKQTLSHDHNDHRWRRQGYLAGREGPEYQMRAAKGFFRYHFRSCAQKLADRTLQVPGGGNPLTSREYLCTLFQMIYDCTYEILLKEIGAKIFQPPNQVVPSEQHSMFLQGYSLLISACELTDTIPDNVKVAIEKRVKEEMQIKDDEILCEFIMNALPITWGMVTTTLPVISSSEFDPDLPPEVVAQSREQAEAVKEWVCIQPALHRCLDPYPEQKARMFLRVETGDKH